jgi:hypothetical protein
MVIELVLLFAAQTANTIQLEPGAQPPKGSIQDVAWIAGNWRGEGLGGVADEIWASPVDRSMAGMFRLVRDGKVAFYELMTLVEDSGSLTLRLKHFHPDLKPWEEKATIDFKLVRIDDRGAWFDGLSMLRDGSDRMVVAVAIRGKDGKVTEGRFTYRRVRP